MPTEPTTLPAATPRAGDAVSVLWPFVVEDASVPVSRWRADTAPSTLRGVLLTGADLPADRAALAQRVAAGGEQLVRGGRIALLAAGRWRRAAPGQRRGPGVFALKRALEAAGFDDLRFFAVAPGAQRPYTLQPTRALTAAWSAAVLTTGRRGAIDGDPRDDAGALLDRIVAHLARQQVVPPQAEVTRVLCSGKDKTLVFVGAGRSRWLVRVPWRDASLQAERAAHAALRSLQASPALAPIVPAPVHGGHVGTQPVFVETVLGGRPLSTVLTAKNRGAHARRAESFLQALNPAPSAWCDDVFDRFARPLLDAVAPHLPDAATRQALQSHLRHDLDGARCPLGLVHGDFGTKNILVTGDRITGVIDWETARRDAPLILDVMGYLDSAQRRVARGQTLADTLPVLAGGDWPEPDEAAMLQRALAPIGGDARARRGFARLYWLAHVAPQLALGGRTAADGRRFDAVLRWMIAFDGAAPTTTTRTTVAQ